MFKDQNYGNPPIVVGSVELYPSEMCFVQYLPIKFIDTDIRIPPNLAWCEPMVDRLHLPDTHIAYLTVRHMWVSNNKGNRLGWHSDGFMSEDINYLWYDKCPTQFCIQDFNLTQDHTKSMEEMDIQADNRNIITYPCKSILRLDEKVVHRVDPTPFEGMRTFVKVSVSKELYNLEGNAHNYLFDYRFDMVPRKEGRNHPIAKP